MVWFGRGSFGTADVRNVRTMNDPNLRTTERPNDRTTRTTRTT